MSAKIALHPNMTANQIAMWCEAHRMIVTIHHTPGPNGTTATILATPQADEDSMSLFFRRQAE